MSLDFNTISKYALIAAGGSGNRMNSAIPKQFLEIGGKPILMHTLLCFASFSPEVNILLVLPENEVPYWQNLCEIYAFELPLTLVNGGRHRGESVKNGLDAIPNDQSLVAIHDGVRPFVDKELIHRSYKIAYEQGNAISCVNLKDSLRKIKDGSSEMCDRNQYRLMQTPQTFQTALIKSAYAQAGTEEMTDDASIAEKAGHIISLIEGSYRNIKITTQEDLLFAETLMTYQNKNA